jgi:hypothetical protein
MKLQLLWQLRWTRLGHHSQSGDVFNERECQEGMQTHPPFYQE